jgi:hypothetical protein
VTTAATPNSVKSAYDLADAAVPKSTIDAKGDLIVGSADNAVVKLTAGTNEQRLVTDSATTSGLKYVADTTNFAIAAKGDLLVGTAADTVAALTAGSNGDTLVADSAATTGLRWQGSMAAGRNAIINGGMDIWQRGTSFTSFPNTTTFTTDRFYSYRSDLGSGLTVSRQSSGLTGIQYAIRVARDSGNANTSSNFVVQDIETSNSIPFAGKSITFSFYARAGADYSATSSALSYLIASGTGTDQRLGTGYTGAVTLTNPSITLTTSWQRFTSTVTVGSTATQLGFSFRAIPTGTAGANDWFEVTGVQLELGSVATPFSRAGGTIQGEIAACQRYYFRMNSNAVSSFAPFAQGGAVSTTSSEQFITFPVTMRTAPSSIDFSTLSLIDAAGGTEAVTALTLGQRTLQSALLTATVASGLTQHRYYRLLANNSASAFVGLNAEL